MAFDKGPCGPQYEDYEDAFSKWENADSAADSSFKGAAVLTGTGLVVCGAAWWTGVGLLGCGVAAGGALIGDGDSISSSLSRNDAKKDRDKALKDYYDCVYAHEKYYGKNRITNPI